MAYQCPKCKSNEILTVCANVDASLSASGDLECLGTNLLFDACSRVDCGICGHHGYAEQFEVPDPPSEREQFGMREQEWDKFLDRMGFNEREAQ